MPVEKPSLKPYVAYYLISYTVSMIITMFLKTIGVSFLSLIQPSFLASIIASYVFYKNCQRTMLQNEQIKLLGYSLPNLLIIQFVMLLIILTFILSPPASFAEILNNPLPYLLPGMKKIGLILVMTGIFSLAFLMISNYLLKKYALSKKTLTAFVILFFCVLATEMALSFASTH